MLANLLIRQPPNHAIVQAEGGGVEMIPVVSARAFSFCQEVPRIWELRRRGGSAKLLRGFPYPRAQSLRMDMDDRQARRSRGCSLRRSHNRDGSRDSMAVR